MLKRIIICRSCFPAVATHKYVISFCVGLELVTAGTPTKLFSAYMAVFALVSPIGVGIGIGISSASGTGDTYTLSVAILQVFPSLQTKSSHPGYESSIRIFTTWVNKSKKHTEIMNLKSN